MAAKEKEEKQNQRPLELNDRLETNFKIISLYNQSSPAIEKEKNEDTTETTTKPASDTHHPTSNSPKATEEEVKRLKDPILQFGILVPPALRAAQASFIDVVEKTVPELVDVDRQMKWLEDEIGRVREMMIVEDGGTET